MFINYRLIRSGIRSKITHFAPSMRYKVVDVFINGALLPWKKAGSVSKKKPGR